MTVLGLTVHQNVLAAGFPGTSSSSTSLWGISSNIQLQLQHRYQYSKRFWDFPLFEALGYHLRNISMLYQYSFGCFLYSFILVSYFFAAWLFGYFKLSSLLLNLSDYVFCYRMYCYVYILLHFITLLEHYVITAFTTQNSKYFQLSFTLLLSKSDDKKSDQAHFSSISIVCMASESICYKLWSVQTSNNCWQSDVLLAYDLTVGVVQSVSITLKSPPTHTSVAFGFLKL